MAAFVRTMLEVVAPSIRGPRRVGVSVMLLGGTAAALIVLKLRQQPGRRLTRCLTKKAVAFGEHELDELCAMVLKRGLGLSTAADIDKLHVIFDFDHTLTSASSPQCHDHLADHEDATLAAEMRRYLDFSDGGHPKLRGLPIVEWWLQVHALLVSKRVSLAQLEAAQKRRPPIQLRHGVAETLTLLLELDVPVTVVSAGLHHVIERVLPFRVCTLADDCSMLRQTNTVHLVSNRLTFGPDGGAVGAAPDIPVHAGNKDTVYMRLRPYFDEVVKSRTKLLVIGDSVGDVAAAKHIPKRQCQTVAYYNPANPWSNRDSFDRTYDALLPHTASMIWLHDGLSRLLAG